MAITIIATEEARKQNRIYNTFKNLEVLDKVVVSTEANKTIIWIKHPKEFVPDFKFVWSHAKQYYRVYIMMANGSTVKEIKGYIICTIKSGFDAIGFCSLYSFLHEHKSNNKSV